MSLEEDCKPIDGYMGLRYPEGHEGVGFCYFPSLEAVREWLAKPPEDESSDPSELIIGSLDSKSKPLAQFITRFVTLTHGQRELVSLSTVMSRFMAEAVARKDVFDQIKSRGLLVEETSESAIYSLEKSPRDWLDPAVQKINRFDSGFKLFPNSVFLGIVSMFDSSVSDTVRTMLSIRGERMKASGRSITISEMLKASSIEELLSKAIDEEIYEFSRGSHDEQVKYIEDSFHIKIRDSWKRWPDFIEVFERRNLIAHGEKTFTKRYVEICNKAGHKGSNELLGKDVRLSQSYMNQSLDVVLEFYILLVFYFWKKHLEDESEAAFQFISDVIFRLVGDKRYTVAIRISEFILSLSSHLFKDVTRRIVVVNLASAYLHVNDNTSCLRVLDNYDWSATADNYQICVASLRNNLPEVVRILPRVAAAGLITRDNLLTWPVFDFVRTETVFQEAYESTFQEKITDQKVPSGNSFSTLVSSDDRTGIE